ncbi:substrate-binding periplasmic protein [Pseudoduganella sp.]|uniref:substrate-binding periplasmic protein n=1 Tax=Pseudoduganella sp. TaxID=1880898 RepID=UPI0035AE88D6
MLDLMRSLRSCAALALLAAGSCLPAHAAPSCPARPIVVGLYEFGHFFSSGAGLDKDLAEELRKRSGCAFSLKVMQRRAIWPALQSGAVDMTFSAAPTPERLGFSWAEPYIWLKNMVVLRKDVAPGVRSMADFIAAPELRLGFGRGYAAGPAYEEFVGQLRNIGRVEDVDDGDRLYAMFKAGRFQAILAPKMAYASYLKDEIMADAVRIEDWSATRPRGPATLMLSKKRFSADEAKRWGELLKAIRADGTLQRFIERYVDPDEAVKMLAP